MSLMPEKTFFSGTRKYDLKTINRYRIILTILLLVNGPACRPVITVGWQEIAFVAFLLLLLLGQPIYQLIRKLTEFGAWRAANRDENNQDDRTIDG
jgi:hypothetical protein